MTGKRDFDVIVIGSGPGGEGAALKLAKSGKSVAVIEKHIAVGGGCTHWGTIPSKALIHLVRDYSGQYTNRLARNQQVQRISIEDLMQGINDIVDQQVCSRQNFYQRNGVKIIEGFAKFVDPYWVEVTGNDGVIRSYSSDHFIIASGSHPYHPQDVPFDDRRIVDSDTVLLMEKIPSSITIYGAGVIGSEYATAFRTMGVSVNLVNTRSRLLEYLDEEISTTLSYHLRDEQGIMIRQNEEYESASLTDDGVILKLKTGKVIKSDMLLWANGRTGNSDGMGLEELRIAIDHRGNLAINENYQTAQPHIYAVGDIIGFPSLASAAFDQGRFAATHIVAGKSDIPPIRDVPTGIYTTPEISCLGKTEHELTENRVPYEVGRAFYRNLARGQITGCRFGMLKLLFHRETLEILGIHCLGRNAAEILHIGQAIMSQPAPNNTIQYFMNTTFNYPTMAEAYRVAALNGFNRL
ncbi:MAG: Si-specific NAD(P)(+) transhydrogenase [Desulfuromonas sp.]|nr:MAG: Si-specific NAD(P)(+) transhydrogenase [Desulfuromonas sp.]